VGVVESGLCSADEGRTSRDDGRRKEQLEALTKVEKLTEGQIEEIAEAGKGRFFRKYMLDVWKNAKQ
jgi:hypothetical protein